MAETECCRDDMMDLAIIAVTENDGQWDVDNTAKTTRCTQ